MRKNENLQTGFAKDSDIFFDFVYIADLQVMDIGYVLKERCYLLDPFRQIITQVMEPLLFFPYERLGLDAHSECAKVLIMG